MRKVFIGMTLGLTVALTGCASLYKVLGTDANKVHAEAVEKAESYAIEYANKKIDKLETTDEAKAALKVEAEKLVKEAFKKIDELKVKYDAAKAAAAVK